MTTQKPDKMHCGPISHSSLDSAIASSSSCGIPPRPFNKGAPLERTAKEASASVKTNNVSSSVPSSLRSSPKVPDMNSFPTPIHLLVDGNVKMFKQRRLSTSSPKTDHTLPLPPADVNAYQTSYPSSSHMSGGSSSSNNNSHSNSNARNRASTSVLSSTPSYANTLPSTLQSIQMSAQAATLAAVAANLTSTPQQLYRTPTSVNLSSSSSPSSSSHFPLHSPLVFHKHQYQQQQMSYEKHTAELTNCIIAFLSPILPTEEEYRIKEASRRQLERLANRVNPGAKLLAFGSMANGFALRNSDMDLCCLLAENTNEEQKTSRPSASELVETLGKLIREETDYTVMPLPKARIPIIKINRSPTSESPYGISCDIGFENRLALENTRLLLTYAMVDPPRLRTLVLFLKVWTKRRKLNSPYTGTLSSYGYTLLMIYFLSHVKKPAVLPNLQRVPPSASSSIRSEDVTLNDYNIYFYDDVATLRKEWSSLNSENVGELLMEFFRFFSKDFGYTRDVISIRTETGLKAKDNQTWMAELCIEDPFQTGYNVGRTVTRDGLYTIRGEFMRASRLLSSRTERMSQVLAELCEEREDGLTRAPDNHYNSRHRSSFAASSYNSANPAAGDLRYLRDLQRRYDLSSSTAVNGFGGSFAFEEMARGLGQAQKNGNMIVYPPTAAMLAPLSQNTGLSPRQSLMRAGLRYDTPRRGPLGAPLNLNSSNKSTGIGSSTRSEDGNSHDFDIKKSMKSSTSSNISASTSPTLESGVASLLHPNSTEQNSETDYSIGDGGTFGSEISFGSQRFQLHPHPSSMSIGSGKVQKIKGEESRAPRSFSDGVNRSMSMPRPGMEISDIRRASTPTLSEPVSPLDGINALSTGVHSLSLTKNVESISPLTATIKSEGNNGIRQEDQQAKRSSSPRLTASPWSMNERRQNYGNESITPEEEIDTSQFTLDDESISLCDIGDTISLANLPRRPEKSEEAVDRLLSRGKEHSVRSWAASQSIHLSPK